MNLNTRYLQLREGQNWLGERVGLDIDRDGALQLMAVPGPADGSTIKLPPPYDLGASGIAVGPCNSLFVSDTINNRVLYTDNLCNAKTWLGGVPSDPTPPGSFWSPRGLAINGEALWIADSGNGRAQSLAFPALEANFALSSGLASPSAVARDSLGNIYVLDGTHKQVHRFDSLGHPDLTYNTTIAANAKLQHPRFFAIDDKDRLLVSDQTSDAILVFDDHGNYSSSLSSVTGALPGALATQKNRLYVADRADGLIRVYVNDQLQGPLQGYRGPVTAMALTPAGDLIVKPGLDDSWYLLKANCSYLEYGQLYAGPFDAGEEIEWFSTSFEANLPSLTRAQLEVAQSPTELPAPIAADWVRVPADAALLSKLAPENNPNPRRWLWLRLELTTSDVKVSATVHQIRARTPGEDYLNYLPAIYSIEDEETRFLRCMLNLAQTEFEKVELALAEMPRHFAPLQSNASNLPWLASWLATNLPEVSDDEERRKLLKHAVESHADRGTVGYLRNRVELHTGIRPHIIESFSTRKLWILGESSLLGFDSALPSIDPNGMVVPDPQFPSQNGSDCCATTVGRAVVGESGPLSLAMIGEPLYSEQAHCFIVYVHAHQLRQAELIEEIRRVLDSEKPAHTDYRLCIIEPDFRVGLQATVGLDTLVAGHKGSLSLGSRHLEWDSQLAPPLNNASRVGQDSAVGQNTILS